MHFFAESTDSGKWRRGFFLAAFGMLSLFLIPAEAQSVQRLSEDLLYPLSAGADQIRRHHYPEDAQPQEGAPDPPQDDQPPPEQQQEQPQWPGMEQPSADQSPRHPSGEVVNPPAVFSPPGADKDSRPAPTTGTGGIGGLKNLEGVVRRFYRFSGERTVKNLAELFNPEPLRQAGFSQHPAIALSDGSSPVAIRLESGLGQATFSFSGARSVTLVQQSDGSWDLEAIPLRGKTIVFLSVLAGKEVVDLPLTVIPPVDEKTARETARFSGAKVAELLAAAGAETSRVIYDLNQDGKQNYLDDYILIGHYLLNLTSGTSPAP